MLVEVASRLEDICHGRTEDATPDAGLLSFCIPSKGVRPVRITKGSAFGTGAPNI
jgi:hypothetical protein